MPALKIPRQERFAQGVANGLSYGDAYRQAGYTAEKAGSPAYQVLNKPGVRDRINELLEQREAVQRKAQEKAAERLSVDCEWVIARLIEAAESQNWNARLRALELIGRELGMFIERRDVTHRYAHLSDDALAAALARYVAKMSRDELRTEASRLRGHGFAGVTPILSHGDKVPADLYGLHQEEILRQPVPILGAGLIPHAYRRRRSS